jgi:hypothetical protein
MDSFDDTPDTERGPTACGRYELDAVIDDLRR